MSPYLIPRRKEFYLELANQGLVKGQEFQFLLVKEQAKHRSYKIDNSDFGNRLIVTKSVQFYIRKLELALDIPLNSIRIVRKQEPSLIVTEGFGLAYLPVMLWARFSRVRLVLWNKSSSDISARRSLFKRIIKKILISFYSDFIAGGESQKRYLENQGIFSIKLYEDTPNLQPFNNVLNEYIISNEDLLRIGFIGELIPRKNLEEIFNALCFAEDKIVYELHVFGTGPLESKLRESSGELNVYFHGFIDPSKLPEELLKIDCLVVPSKREAWGLVVEEALACGLVCIASDQVGSSARAVEFNHFRSYPSGDVNALFSLLFSLYKEMSKERKSRVSNGRYYLNAYNHKKSASQFIECLK